MRIRTIVLALAALAFALGACEPASTNAPADLGWGDELGRESLALETGQATLLLLGDGNVVRGEQEIMAGGTLQIDYAPERLPNCRATYNGLDAWSIQGFVAVDGGAAEALPLAANGALLRATWTVPSEASEIALWFLNTDRAGCQDYDSLDGANYVYAVASPSVVTPVVFASDWTESTEGDIVQGGSMQIVYSPARLRACRGTYHGGRTYNIYANWVFEPGGQLGHRALYDGNYFGGEDSITEPIVSVPEDATSVSFWFSNSDYYGCSAWDSDYGANYSFPIVETGGGESPEIGWAGELAYVQYHRDPAQSFGDRDPVWYFDNWSGAELTAWVEVQVWAPGLTDQAYDSTALPEAAEAIRAEFVTDGGGGDSPEGWLTKPMSFQGQRGNNFVYQLQLWQLRSPYTTPALADGLHQYYLRLSANDGATWTPIMAEDGGYRRLVIAAQRDCALFPDNPPDECPRAAEVGWTGNWGAYVSHACRHEDGLADPVTFTKSAVGHDCMSLTAEVWVEGVTDLGGDANAIRAEVETDIGFSGGPLDELTTYALTFDGAVGNNYRYRWNLGEHVGRAERGDYQYRFRFSADDGATWTLLGNDDDNGLRTLLVRNDSTDIGETLTCDGLQTWEGVSATYEACIAYVPENVDATNCEFYVNALGRGHYAHNAAWGDWLEAWIQVGSPEGVVENVGLWVAYEDADGAEAELFSMGQEFEPNYWLTGFTFGLSAVGRGPEAVPIQYTVTEFAFFLDVRRPSGEVTRLWQSAGGANYTLAACYAVPGYSHGIGIGEIEYADESVGLFDAKRSCQ